MKSATRNYILLFLGCVLFHIIGTWSIPLLDRDEPRFAEASREMIERGDYIVPHFNNQPRLDKPPFAYWAQVASFRIFGENDFAARFPSAIAAALVAMSILAWGKRIGGERVGWWAAIMFTLSLQTFIHAKAAVADMWLVLFVTIAHGAGWELFFGKRSTLNVQRVTSKPEGLGWWFTFYFSLALGFLAKGPIAWVPLLTVVVARFCSGHIQIAKQLKLVRGILLMLAIVALWGVPALIQTHGEFFRIGIGRHVIGRSFRAMEGHGGNALLAILFIPFYFVTVFISFFPWSITLPRLIRGIFSKGSADRYKLDWTDIYLLWGAGIIFLIFTFVKTKLPHYTLPAFPLLALLAARHIERERFLKGAAIAVTCLYLAFAFFAAPFASQFFPAKQLFEQTKKELRPEMEFGAVDFQEPSLVWYFRSRVKRWMTPMNAPSASEFMEKDGARFVIAPTGAIAKTLPANWKTLETSGFNIAKGKHVDLTLVLKPE